MAQKRYKLLIWFYLKNHTHHKTIHAAHDMEVELARKVESTNWVDVDIGGKPDVTIHKVGNHQVLTFTFEQDGHKYMVGIYNQGGIDMVEIHE